VAAGPGYVQTAMESMMPGFGNYFVAIALFFFAFTTIIAYYYIAETNIAFINRKIHRPWLTFLLKLCLMAPRYMARFAPRIWRGDWGISGLGLMAWLNIIAIVLLHKKAFASLKDYEIQNAGAGSTV
jgi:AGCS family alanine or glycine:cation symporter